MTVTAVSSLEQFKEIIARDEPSVFDFWATWCGPCRAISPIFEKLCSETKEGVAFYKVDVDAVPDVAKFAGIHAMPTFISYHNNKKLETLVGAKPPLLKTLIDNAIERKSS